MLLQDVRAEEDGLLHGDLLVYGEAVQDALIGTYLRQVFTDIGADDILTVLRQQRLQIVQISGVDIRASTDPNGSGQIQFCAGAQLQVDLLGVDGEGQGFQFQRHVQLGQCDFVDCCHDAVQIVLIRNRCGKRDNHADLIGFLTGLTVLAFGLLRIGVCGLVVSGIA